MALDFKKIFTKKPKKEKIPEDSTKTQLITLINKILKEGDSIFTILQPKIFWLQYFLTSML